jgi:hypothetical protein
LVCGEHPNKPYTIEQAISIHNSIEGNKKIISQNGQYSIQYITSNV